MLRARPEGGGAGKNPATAGWFIRAIGVIRGEFSNPFYRGLHGLRGGGVCFAHVQRAEARARTQPPLVGLFACAA